MIRIVPSAHRLALLATVALASPALAQETTPANETTHVDEIIVTGQRAQARVATGVLAGRAVEDTPYAIVTFTDDYLEAIQARALSDVLRGDPSIAVTSSASGSSSNQTIRGFTTSGSNQFFDGLSASAIAATNFPVNALERIEVVKGPNSVLSGASAAPGPGGTINLVPRKPLATADQFFNATGSFTEKDLLAAGIDAGTRFGLGDAFGARLNLGIERGTIAAQSAERQFSNVDAVFDWRPSDRLVVTLGVHVIDTTFKRYLNTLTLGSGVPVPDAPDPRATITQPWSYFTQNLRFATLSGDWKLSDEWSLEVGTLVGMADRPFLSVAGTIVAANGDTRNNNTSVDSDYAYSSHQATLRGAFTTGPLNHAIAFTGNYNAFDLDTFNISFPQFTSNIYRRNTVPRPAVTSGERGRSFEQAAASVGITDVVEVGPVTLIGGLRWNRIEQRNLNPLNGIVTRDYGEEAVVPTVATQIAATPRLNLYANYSEGLEQGGTAPVGATNANEVQPPIRSEQYEIGAKWQPTDRLLVTAAVFRITKGLEFLDAATNTYVQSGRQRHDGAELILSGELTPGLTISGGYTWLDPTARRTGNAATDGNDAIGVSRHNLSLFGEYRLPLSMDLRLNGTVEYRSSQFVDLANSRAIEDWTIFGVGARLNLDAGGTPLRLTARIDNLFDKAFWQSASGGALAIGNPRTLTLAIGTSF